MKKLILSILIISTYNFCMEPEQIKSGKMEEGQDYFSSLPGDMKNQIFKWVAYANNLPIKEAVKELVDKTRVNKEFKKFFEFKYPPKNISLIYTDNLLDTAIEFDADNLANLIIDNYKEFRLTIKELENALKWAAVNKKQQLVDKLLNIKGIDPKNIFISLPSGAKISLLEKARGNIKVRGLNKERELFNAVENGDLLATKYLVENGVNPNTYNSIGLTLLMMAASCNHENIVKLLLQYGANVNAKSDNNSNALLWAVRTSGNSEENILKLLIENRASLNEVNNNGFTPLLFAAKFGREGAIKLLLKYGADKNIMVRGQTASQLARRYGYDDAADIIDNYKE